MSTPLPYQSSFETLEKNEAETTAALTETMHGISETTFKDYGHAVRSVHAKSHGLLRGEMTVLPNLPPELAQGIFSKQATYPVVMRLSTSPADIMDDSVSTPRGLAVKVIGVEGERLPGSEGDATQDFVMVNGPYFQVAHAKSFLQNLKLLAATTDKAEGFKKGVSASMRGMEAMLESVGLESATVKSMGGQPYVHPLGDAYFTQAPLLHGPYMAKISVAPVGARLLALEKQKIEVNGRPDALREEIVDFFAVNGGEWEVRVQLCTDLEKMPIEDPSKEWPEDLSPYVAVARITVAPQAAWNAERSAEIDDGMSFSPWHGVAAHRPIGAIMRARKSAYEMSANFRGSRNGCPMREPRDASDLKVDAA